MPHDPSAQAHEQAIDEASTIAMDRYELSQPRALALLVRLARHHHVELRVVAAAVIAAALARRNLGTPPGGNASGSHGA